ncbi:MAG: hypothetical protein GY749_12925 [Desulfobacteraceae bacterium]|nr:hypothetical protein [Desulfobacteraceae bacterium]
MKRKRMKFKNVMSVMLLVLMTVPVFFQGSALADQPEVSSIYWDNKGLNIVFSREMDCSSVSEALTLEVVVTGVGYGTVSGTAVCDAATTAFISAGDLLPGLNYRVKLSADARDAEGNPLGSAYESSFKIAPDLILIERENLFPEGIEYDAANNRFLIGSLTEGTIFAVADDGSYQAFIEDDALVSTLGLEIDAERNRLLVVNVENPAVYADPAAVTKIYLGIYNLTTGERLDMISLTEEAGQYVANDVAVDAEGNAYVTDTSALAVYKVDTDGNASVFLQSDQFVAPNGIVCHPDGYLFVADASLYKVPLDNPEGFTPVEVDRAVKGADGMILLPGGNLVVVAGMSQTVFSLNSDDNWATATAEAADADQSASTVALRGGQVYAVWPHLAGYFNGETVETFEIVHVEFAEISDPDLILVEREDLFPEGIEYDAANNRFLIGSLTEGTIFAVSDDGSYQAFIEDDALVSTLGLEIDAERNRLLVANVENPAVYTDPSVATQIYLGIYNLTTGERIHMVPLVEGEPGEAHIANDVAVDAEGNAYVTDTSALTVYKVDVDGNASVFVQSDQFTAPNGIVWHPDGYLFVADASLFKVPLDNPQGLTPVEMEQTLEGADGMLLLPDGNLIVVASMAQTIFSLDSDDDWASAAVEAVAADQPASTVTLRGDKVYAVWPHLGGYFTGETVEAFEIVRAEFAEISYPDMILIERENLVPEGIEYDAANNRFLVGSIAEGSIFEVMDDGSHQAFIEDADLVSTVGIEIDEQRNRLLVANVGNPAVYTDPSAASQIYLGIYDLTTGERIRMVPLGEPGYHIANDVAVDAEGNAYITDTYASTVYKVDTDGNASVFVESDQFVGLNGIVCHPGGYLLLADATIYKVPLDNPGGLAPVEMVQPVEGGDGMILLPDGSMIVVGSVAQTIFSLDSDDDWASATVKASSVGHTASTVALRGNRIYAVYPHLGEYFTGQTVEVYEIVRVEFDDVP